MKKSIKSIISMSFFALLLSISTNAFASYKTEIGTCSCGIDDYKCINQDGSCNVHSQTICEIDCSEQ